MPDPTTVCSHKWIIALEQLEGRWDNDGSAEWLASKEGKRVEFRLCLEHVVCTYCNIPASALVQLPHREFHIKART